MKQEITTVGHYRIPETTKGWYVDGYRNNSELAYVTQLYTCWALRREVVDLIRRKLLIGKKALPASLLLDVEPETIGVLYSSRPDVELPLTMHLPTDEKADLIGFIPCSDCHNMVRSLKYDLREMTVKSVSIIGAMSETEAAEYQIAVKIVIVKKEA